MCKQIIIINMNRYLKPYNCMYLPNPFVLSRMQYSQFLSGVQLVFNPDFSF